MKSFSLRLLLYVIVLGVGMGAAFGAGIAYGKVAPQAAAADVKATGDQPIAQARASGQAGAEGSGTAAGGRGAGSGGMGPTMINARPVISGTVDSVAADGLTVATGQGQPAKVTLGPRATVEKTMSLADLKKGDRVSVMGQRGSDGAVTAVIVQVLPSN